MTMRHNFILFKDIISHKATRLESEWTVIREIDVHAHPYTGKARRLWQKMILSPVTGVVSMTSKILRDGKIVDIDESTHILLPHQLDDMLEALNQLRGKK